MKKIYAYSTDSNYYDKIKNNRLPLIKVGETTGSVRNRVRHQDRESNPEPLILLKSWAVPNECTDHQVRHKLVHNGFNRVRSSREWMECNLSNIEDVIFELTGQIQIFNDEKGILYDVSNNNYISTSRTKIDRDINMTVNVLEYIAIEEYDIGAAFITSLLLTPLMVFGLGLFCWFDFGGQGWSVWVVSFIISYIISYFKLTKQTLIVEKDFITESKQVHLDVEINSLRKEMESASTSLKSTRNYKQGQMYLQTINTSKIKIDNISKLQNIVDSTKKMKQFIINNTNYNKILNDVDYKLEVNDDESCDTITYRGYTMIHTFKLQYTKKDDDKFVNSIEYPMVIKSIDTEIVICLNKFHRILETIQPNYIINDRIRVDIDYNQTNQEWLIQFKNVHM